MKTKEKKIYPSQYSLQKSPITVYEDGDSIIIYDENEAAAVKVLKKDADNVALMIQHLIKGIPD